MRSLDYLDEAADPIFEANRHAKTGLKKLMRGVRPIERSFEGGEDEQTGAMRSYCLAVLKSHSPMMAIHRCVPPVRVLAALALRRQCFLPRALILDDLEEWSSMRE